MANTSPDFDYGNTLDGIAERITTSLGDDEKGHANTTYDKEYIKALVCDAIQMVSQLKPDILPAFEVEWMLTAGQSMQRLPEECEDFVEWLHFSDEDGRQVPVLEGDYDLLRRTAFFPQPCANCRGGVMSTVSSYDTAFSPESDRVFAISPMPPPGVMLTAVALCRSIDRIVGDGSETLPQKLRSHIPAIQLMAMSLAVSKDNPTASQAHFNNFLNMANLSLQQQSLASRLRLEADRLNNG